MSISKILKIVRPCILLIAIITGFIIFSLFHFVKALAPIKPIAYTATDILPFLIFVMLFCAFCKIDVRQMKPRHWHYLLLLVQIGISGLLAFIITVSKENEFNIILEGMIACILCPTATSAAVITAKLGGNESSLTSYTVLSSILGAIGIPLIYPIVTQTNDFSFVEGFLTILKKVFPMLGMPLILALLLKRFLPNIHAYVAKNTKDLGFYLWVFTLVILSAKTFSNLFAATCSNLMLIYLAISALFSTVFQFCLGKFIGNFEGQRISAGQGLGQKNMVVGVWSAITYLNPTVAIAPGCYILWQNLINAWQMWYRQRLLAKWEKEGVKPYQE